MSPAQRTWTMTKTVKAVVFGYVLSLASVGYAWHTSNDLNQKALDETEARADAFEARAEKDRLIFCRFFEPYAANPTPPVTEQAKAFKEGAKYAVGTDGFNCTPDPTDGK